MTTPNSEFMKDKQKMRKLMAEEMIQGFDEEQYEKFLEFNTTSNPAANPKNPWIIAEKQRERDI